MGRPSEYTEERAALICDRLAGGETLRAICRDEDMPDRNTVFRWIRGNESFHRQYARAREVQADAWAEEIAEIADDGRNDWVEGENGASVNHEHIQRSRLRVDTRKWLMGKAAPKKYGDKLALSGDGAGDPIRTVTEVVFVRPVAQAHDEAAR